MEQPSSFQAHLAAGLSAALKPLGIPLVAQLWGENTDRTPSTLLTLLDHLNPTALVLNPLTRGNEQVAVEKILASRPDIPLIHLCGHGRGASFRGDNALGMRLIVEHLVHDCAVRNILVVRGNQDHIDSQEREAAVLAELTRLGRPLDPAQVVTGGYERDIAARVTRTALERAPDIDAVLAFNDRSALGAVDAVLASGRRVPEDVVVTGFDDEDFAAFCQPPLTTVSQNLFQIGYTAGTVLPRILAGEDLGEQRVPVRLVRRRSSRLPGTGPPPPDPDLPDLPPADLRLWDQLAALDTSLALSRQFMGCRTIEQTMDELCDTLPVLGVTRAFLVLHTIDPAGASRGVLAVSYHDGIRSDEHHSGPFPLDQLLPDDLHRQLDAGTLVVQPLQVDGVEIGYLILDQPLHQISYTTQMLTMGLTHTIDTIRRTARMAERTRQLEREVATRRAAQKALAYQAHHDALTGLPNRGAFQRIVDLALTDARTDGGTLLLVGLDRFKDVNDTLGHSVGDALLREVASRLSTVFGGASTTSRLGSDQFAVFVPDVQDADEALALAREVTTALRTQYHLDDVTLEIEASIGVACSPLHADNAETLLRMADLAMYTVKSAHTGIALYDPEEHQKTPARLALFGELRRALKERELVLHYQPVVDLHGGRATGVEALVRWEHPTLGLLPPSEFIEMAEQTGLIHDLTMYVLDQALSDCRAWSDRGLDLVVAVNLSTRRLMDVDLPAEVTELLERHRIPASQLVLEVTETAAMIDPQRALVVLEGLRALGIRVSVDDFGTGHASLAYLSRLPVTALKIDRSFVLSMETDHANLTIVRSTLNLADSLGIRVIAEGVETESAYRLLRSFGCAEAQGYWFSRPRPATEIPDIVTELHHRLVTHTATDRVPLPRSQQGGLRVEPDQAPTGSGQS